MSEIHQQRVTIAIELDVTLNESTEPQTPGQEPFELSVARQLHSLLRDGSVDPSSLFTYHGCDVSFGNFSGLFAIENPSGYSTR
jgi:hypothetical protein